MIKKSLLCCLLLFLFASPVFAVRILPPGSQPESIEGEAKGNIPELHGSGILTFTNTGGDARLTTSCDASQVQGANSVSCEGIDVTGSFSGGPDGVAVFKTGGSEVRLQLTDGKVFSYSAMGLTMNFTVTDPSIFDAWVENTGGRDSGARMSHINGQLEIACPPDLEAWDVMKMGRVIYVDCHLKTGEDSTAVISFSDMTSFTMKPETEIVIDTPPEKESKLSLLVGNIWVNVKQMVKDGTMKVHTSQAVAGIKGTRFILTETGKESKIDVAEGTVSFQSKANGKEIFVSVGESVKATETGLSEKTSFDATIFPENWNEKIDTPAKQSVQSPKPQQTTKYAILAGILLFIFAIAVAGVIYKKKTRS